MSRFLKTKPPARSAEVVQRSCTAKRRYTSEEVARACGVGYQAQNKLQLWVYACKQCLGWHLTKREQGNRAAVDCHATEAPQARREERQK